MPSNGGPTLHINNQPVQNTDTFKNRSTDDASNTLGNEYRRQYARMAEIIRLSQCDVDLRPLQLIADCFLIANVSCGEAFLE